MDPVNKWLTVIILFMISLLFVIWSSAGVGRYEMTVTPSSLFDEHYVIFTLDTKDGEIHSKIIDEDEMLNSANKIRSMPTKVFEQPSAYGYRNRY